MIAATYAASGVGLLATGYAFSEGWLSAGAQSAAWAAIFFVASAAASSAYLTVSEIFPVEIRAISISLFYALGTGVGGFIAPALHTNCALSHGKAALPDAVADPDVHHGRSVGIPSGFEAG